MRQDRRELGEKKRDYAAADHRCGLFGCASDALFASDEEFEPPGGRSGGISSAGGSPRLSNLIKFPTRYISNHGFHEWRPQVGWEFLSSEPFRVSDSAYVLM